MKEMNSTSIAFGVAAGFLTRIFGAWDTMLQTILLLCVIDYISGLMKAGYTKQLSSEIGWKGIVKKVAMFLVIALANIIQGVIGQSLPLREIVIMFFVANEGLSILENCAVMVPIPEKLRDMLLQIRDKTNNLEENKEDE